MNTLIQLSALFFCVLLLMGLVVRGRSIFVVAPLCAVLANLFAGRDPIAAMNGPYLTGFADYLRRFYLLFALGAVFGKLMEDSGAATSIARAIGGWLGNHRACLAVVLAAAVLTYGGVSLFVVGFSVYPLAVQLFRSANLPRRFIPGALAFGSITFTMTSAGSPEIQNLIPIQYLVDAAGRPLTDARAGWRVSLIVAGVMFALGQLYLEWAIRRDVARGGRFEPHPLDPADADQRERSAPAPWLAILPLAVTLLTLNGLPALVPLLPNSAQGYVAKSSEDPVVSILLGVLVGAVCFRRWVADGWGCFATGFANGFLAAGTTAAVVGFGASVKELPSFTIVVERVTHLPGDPLVSAAIAVAVIAAIAGSASGGQGIALPILKPIYVDQLGVAPKALHRVVAIASGTLDSLPANGYLVMLIQTICRETHARAYGPIFVTTVLIPVFGVVLAIALFKTFPAWAL